MKYSKLFFTFLLTIFFTGCSTAPKIVQKEYSNEKMLFTNYRITFEIHLENIGISGKIYNLVNNLIYDNKNFNEYIKYTEDNFIRLIDEENYLPMTDEEGTEYLYQAYLNEKYSIVFYNDTHIIIKYDSYSYYAGAAHGNSLVEYFIIDLNEKRILDIDDLFISVPQTVIKGMLESNYAIENYLRENIWPPDTVNFRAESVELIWNTYTITPYVFGTIDVEVPYNVIEHYLTYKGKALKKGLSNSEDADETFTK